MILSFEKREKLSAEKMNTLAGQVAAGSSLYGGVRSQDGTTPIRLRDRKLKERTLLYEATADATWDATDATDEHWSVTVKRVNNDGTLATTIYTKRAYGIETDTVPIISGDRCIETLTGEGKRAVMPFSEYEPFFPFQMVEDGAAYKMRGGTITVIDGALTHSVMQIGGGNPATLSAAIDTSTNKNIVIEITTTAANPADWTAAITTLSAWPTTATGKKYLRIARDLSATATPDIQQLWHGGDITLDYGVFGSTPAELAAAASVGSSLQYARSDHAHIRPRWNEIRTATGSVSVLHNGGEADYRQLKFGDQGSITEWDRIIAYAADLWLGNAGSAAADSIKVTNGSAITVRAYSENLTIIGLPTTDPGGSNRVWNDAGTLKIT